MRGWGWWGLPWGSLSPIGGVERTRSGHHDWRRDPGAASLLVGAGVGSTSHLPRLRKGDANLRESTLIERLISGGLVWISVLLLRSTPPANARGSLRTQCLPVN
jgi:hypothetical protein